MQGLVLVHVVPFAQVHQCGLVKQAYAQGGCCSNPSSTPIADSLVFPEWSTRFDMTANYLKRGRGTIFNGSTFDAAVDTMAVEIMRRYPTEDEKRDFADKSASQIVKTMAYYDSTLALKNATFMKENETGVASGASGV